MKRPTILNVQLNEREQTERIIIRVNPRQLFGQLGVVLDGREHVEVGVYLPLSLVAPRSEDWR